MNKNITKRNKLLSEQIIKSLEKIFPGRFVYRSMNDFTYSVSK